MTSHADIVKRGWAAVALGDWDTLAQDYTEDMVFVMPGQEDVFEGKSAFRQALEGLGAIVPPGFEITATRQIGTNGEVVSILDWKCDKIPDGSQMAVLFRFAGDLVHEERWFIDTAQWKAAF
ncbi:MAG: nuclear transport factor 2 family protein [Alphaproteobacteria bacterium]